MKLISEEEFSNLSIEEKKGLIIEMVNALTYEQSKKVYEQIAALIQEPKK